MLRRLFPTKHVVDVLLRVPVFSQVHWSERYERAWAPHAWASLCVSKAMQKELARNWKVCQAGGLSQRADVQP